MADSSTLSTVISKFREREALGLRKYGTTVDRTDLSHLDWLQHALEEGMDKMLYLQRAMDTTASPRRKELLHRQQQAELVWVMELQRLIDMEAPHG